MSKKYLLICEGKMNTLTVAEDLYLSYIVPVLETNVVHSFGNESALALLDGMRQAFEDYNSIISKLSSEKYFILHAPMIEFIAWINYLKTNRCITPFVYDYLCNEFDDLMKQFVQNTDRELVYGYIPVENPKIDLNPFMKDKYAPNHICSDFETLIKELKKTCQLTENGEHDSC